MTENKRWILLRGLARGRGHWGSFIEKFAAAHPGDEIECLDLPGNGERNKEFSPLAVSEYVSDLRRQSRFVKAGESFQVVAVSLGAMIAVEWMHRFPWEVQKAYLICTSSSSTSKFYERYQTHNILPTLGLAGVKDPRKWEETILGMVANNQKRRNEELPGLAKYSEKYPQSSVNVLRQLVAAARFQIPKEVPGDIHLIGSYGDRLVSPDCTTKLAERWGLKPTMHPWAGHDIPIDDPQWLIERLL